MQHKFAPVHITPTADETVDRAVARLLERYAARARGGLVLLKPNLHGGHGHTSLAVIEAVARWAISQGAAEVVVGEGPYWGMADFHSYLSAVGVSDLCSRLGVRVVNFHDGDYDVVTPAMPALPDTLGVTSWLRRADLAISIPVMKTHFNTLTTLAFKNLKGFIRPADKRDIHARDLHLAVAALPLFVAPHVHLLDATVAYEGMGPSAATPLEMNLLLASEDPFPLDALSAWLMGIPPAHLRYLREAERLGLGTLPPDDASVAALTPDASAPQLISWRRRFKLPHDAMEEDFPGLAVSTELACSGCLMNLFSALRKLKDEGFADHLSGSVAVGKPPPEVDLAIGNCTFSAWERSAYVPGCPPTIAEIESALRQKLLQD